MAYLPLVLAFWFLMLATLCAILYSQVQPKHPLLGFAPKYQRASEQLVAMSQAKTCEQYWQDIPKPVYGRSWNFQCPCGKSFVDAAIFWTHRDKCWALGHTDSLFLSRNRAGGLQVKGDRWRIPSILTKKGNYRNVPVPSNGCPKPKYPSYSGKFIQWTPLMCDKKWLKRHAKELPEQSLDIIFDSDGANRPVSLVDLAEMYPKIVKKFGDKIKIT